ncbi:unnamed protein product [Paramecium sonneborni]|uniref:Mini antigen n=1 Tax=Paramecium sonneborni TaxID=65129 RepID=A0A8S1MY70_9CILI|nr:unnamed protein product [Paramecium sonneborni]
MKKFIIGYILLVIVNSATPLSLSQFNQCTCQNAKQQDDCLIDYCIWDPNQSTCSNKSCSVFNKNDCLGVPSPFKCVWNYTSSKCESFTKCADYTFSIPDGERCYALFKCQVDVNTINNTDQTVKCMDRTSDSAKSIGSCDKVPFNECLWLVTSDGKQCIRNTQTQACETKLITKCSDYTTNDSCNTQACFWEATTCKPLTCSYFNDKSCILYFSFDFKQVTFCNWNGKSCLDLDTTTLTQQQCLSFTLYSYIWDPDTKKCEVCSEQEESSSTGFLIYTSLLMALVFN